MAKTKSSKGRWGGIPVEERSVIMRRLAKKKQAALSPEAKRQHALKMVRAKRKKNLIVKK